MASKNSYKDWSFWYRSKTCQWLSTMNLGGQVRLIAHSMWMLQNNSKSMATSSTNCQSLAPNVPRDDPSCHSDGTYTTHTLFLTHACTHAHTHTHKYRWCLDWNGSNSSLPKYYQYPGHRCPQKNKKKWWVSNCTNQSNGSMYNLKHTAYRNTLAHSGVLIFVSVTQSYTLTLALAWPNLSHIPQAFRFVRIVPYIFSALCPKEPANLSPTLNRDEKDWTCQKNRAWGRWEGDFPGFFKLSESLRLVCVSVCVSLPSPQYRRVQVAREAAKQKCTKPLQVLATCILQKFRGFEAS